MKKRILLQIVLLSNLCVVASAADKNKPKSVQKEYSFIEPMDLKDIEARRPEDVRKRCRFDVLNAYSLYSDTPSLSFKNPICPRLAQNCCGPRDIKKIPELWKYDQKRMQAHNTVYLKTLRYLVGFGKEYYRIAMKMRKQYERKKTGLKLGRVKKEDEKKDDEGALFEDITEKCYKASLMVTTLNYDKRPKAAKFYDGLNDRARFLQTVRHKFYCMLCAPTPLKNGKVSQDNETIVKKRGNPFGESIVRLPKSTCYHIANNTVEMGYELFHNYGVFLENTMKMAKCIKVQANKFDIKSSRFNEFADDPLGLVHVDSYKTRVRNCKNSLNEKYKTGECRKYCKKFNLAKPTPLFDGDMPRIVEIYEYLKQLEPFMKNPSINLFGDDLAKLKTHIINFEKKREENFYKSINPTLDIAKFKTIIMSGDESEALYTNPLVVGEKTTLHFSYKFQGIMSAFVGLLVMSLLH